MGEYQIEPNRDHEQSAIPVAQRIHEARRPHRISIADDSGVSRVENRMPDGSIELPEDCHAVLVEYPTNEVLINQRAATQLATLFGHANVHLLPSGQIRIQLKNGSAAAQLKQISKDNPMMRIYPENDVLQRDAA